MADPRLKALVFEQETGRWSPVDPASIEERLHAPGAIVWLDVEHLDQGTADMLGHVFGFHELALEDALHSHQRPKIDQYGDHDFLVAYALTLEGDDVRGHEMAAFVATDFLVTVRMDPVFDQARVVERWDGHPELQPEGGGYLLYLLLDEIVDGYFVTLDEIGEAADDLIVEAQNIVFTQDFLDPREVCLRRNDDAATRMDRFVVAEPVKFGQGVFVLGIVSAARGHDEAHLGPDR